MTTLAAMRCPVCFRGVGPDGSPLLGPSRLPSRSHGDDSSFVVFGLEVCNRCRLREGRVIEYREGFAFLGLDRELYVVVEGRVYDVNTETLERREVER